MLNIGRQIGLENLSQIRKLYKGLQSDKAGTYTAHLVMDTQKLDSFTNTSTISTPENNALNVLMKNLFPKTTDDSAKTIMDVVIKKFNNEPLFKPVVSRFKPLLVCENEIPTITANKFNNNLSAAISINTVNKAGDEIIGKSNVKILSNNAGKKLTIKGSNEEAPASLNVDAQFSKTKAANGYGLRTQDNIKAIKYTEADGIGTVAINTEKNGEFNKLNFEYKMPVKALDAMSEEVSEGEFKKFGQIIDDAKYKLSDEYKIEQEKKFQELYEQEVERLKNSQKNRESYQPSIFS